MSALNKKSNGVTPAKKSVADQDLAKPKRLSMTDIPRRSLRECLALAQALTDDFAASSAAPHQVAMAIDFSPTSSSWRDLAASTVAYGLTKGGWNSNKISLEPLGLRCTAPKIEGDDLNAKAEAALKPRVFGEFFKKYDRSKFPSDPIARNVLQHDFGVPSERTVDVLQMLKDIGAYVGFIQETKTGPFVSVSDLRPSPVMSSVSETHEIEPDRGRELAKAETFKPDVTTTTTAASFKVFITHGRNRAYLSRLKIYSTCMT